MAVKAKHPKAKRPKGSIPGIPVLRPLNIWGVITQDGSAGIVTLAKGQSPSQLTTGGTVLYARKLGDTSSQRAAYQRFVHFSARHASFLRESVHGGKSLRVIFNQGLGTGGALVKVKSEAGSVPDLIIGVTTVATLGGAAALGVPEALLAGGAGDVGAGAAGAGAGEAAGGAAAGGGAASAAKKGAAALATASVAGLFTNISWWKGAGMIVIGLVLGVLAIREFSP